MPLAMKQNVTANPVAISLLRPNRVVLETDHLTDLVQQLELGIGNEPLPGF